MKKNILVTTLGTSWQIIPELFGFTNPEDLPLYKGYEREAEINKTCSENKIETITEIWVVTSDPRESQEDTRRSIIQLTDWAKQFSLLKIKVFYPEGISEMISADECKKMKDLIFRVVLHASTIVRDNEGSRLYLSLAGGRKTMSADMQEAAHFFGCDALIHVLGDPLKYRKPGETRIEYCQDKTSYFVQPIINLFKDPDYKDCEVIVKINPVVTMPFTQPSNLFKSHASKVFNVVRFPLSEAKADVKYDSNPIREKKCDSRTDLISAYSELLKQAASTYSNFSEIVFRKEKQPSFFKLYSLPPETIKQLRDERIGAKREHEDQDLLWIQKLPKPDLHCHFGGFFNSGEVIRIAQAVVGDTKLSHDQKTELTDFNVLLDTGDLQKIRDFLYSYAGGIKEGVTTSFMHCALLNEVAKKGGAGLLDQLIYLKYSSTDTICDLGIDTYMELGNLSGSALFQTEIAIREACRIIKEHVTGNNIRYLELRCSPCNYSRESLKPMEVVQIMQQEFAGMSNAQVKLIIIATRHGEMSEVYKHIELYREILRNSATKKDSLLDMIVGFDLAGDESKGNIPALREAFLDLMKESIHITVHAGETMAISSIWSAVYNLNAERIGHGLKLTQGLPLTTYVVDRKIAVEMCPSSNFQIGNYRDYLTGKLNGDVYPLEQYLNSGIRATINTDNPGISGTNINREYYKACCMTEGGLSKWQILQLVRNGFRSGFCSFETRQDQILQAQSQIFELISKEYGGV